MDFRKLKERDKLLKGTWHYYSYGAMAEPKIVLKM